MGCIAAVFEVSGLANDDYSRGCNIYFINKIINYSGLVLNFTVGSSSHKLRPVGTGAVDECESGHSVSTDRLPTLNLDENNRICSGI